MFRKRLIFWTIVAAIVALPLMLCSVSQAAESGCHKADGGATTVKAPKR